MMNRNMKLFYYFTLVGCSIILLFGCGKEQSQEMEEVNKIDPNNLEEGTIIFDFQGKTIKTIEVSASRENESDFVISGLWLEESNDNLLISNLLTIHVFAVEPLDELGYELVWEECSANIADVPCGFFGFVRSDTSYISQASDTFLKLDFQQFGKQSGEKVIGTFEARTAISGEAENGRFDITNGAFNLVLQ